jgi:KDO2-lipid IV(A) lauroyltransferase
VFAWAQRLPGSAGFKIVFLPGEAAMRDADANVAVAALNRGVEACARRAMAQYQWGYKRFSISPPGEPHRYNGHV